MHYHAEIWLPTDENVEQQVKGILAPFDENLVGTEDGWWDWWQIGGRYKGCHIEGYDSESDPNHEESCDLCGGTGFRNDGFGVKHRRESPTYTCNACGTFDHETQTWKHGPLGPGVRVSWPTQWEPHSLDVIPLADAKDDLTCYSLIVSNGPDTQVFHVKEWDGDTFVETGFDKQVKPKLAELGITDGYLITVDYHC
jgi:hypothetical protein